MIEGCGWRPRSASSPRATVRRLSAPAHAPAPLDALLLSGSSGSAAALSGGAEALTQLLGDVSSAVNVVPADLSALVADLIATL
ncbi:hypothetical protein [Mycobacterium sp.]|uniref:hypothetical protein n=1 Tax=Mycobacterium sp. TaxID=1785 RepID=UPI0031D5E691